MRTAWTFGLVAVLGFTQCTLVSKVGGGRANDDVPYDAEVQRAYFEGQHHLLKGDLNDAYASFLRCATAQPDEAAFHFNLARIDLELERYEAAEASLDRALKIDEDNSWYAYHRAEARLGQGNGAGAAEDWLRFVVACPGNLEALMECVDRLLLEGHIMSALAVMDGYEAEVGWDEDVRMEAFRILQALTEPEDMGPFIEQAVKDFPGSNEFLYHKAEWHIAMEQLKEAEALLSPMAKALPDWGRVHFALAQIATKRSELNQAYQHLLQAFPSEDVPLKDKLRVIIGYGILAQTEADFVEPYESLLDVLMNRHGDEPSVVQLACDWAYTTGDLPEALGHANDLVSLAPGQIDSWTNLLAILAESRQWKDVVTRAEEAIARFPLDPILHYHVGMAHQQRKAWTEACDGYRGGLAVVLDSPAIEAALASGLAHCLKELNDLDASEAAFERSLAAVADAYVLNNHAYYLAGRYNMPAGKAKLERALECSTQANDMMPEEGNFMDTQAYVLFKLERHEEALTWILMAQDNGMENDPVALEHEGDIRWAMGDEAGARKAFQQALDAGGDESVLTPKLNRP